MLLNPIINVVTVFICCFKNCGIVNEITTNVNFDSFYSHVVKVLSANDHNDYKLYVYNYFYQLFFFSCGLMLFQ